jgi:hypothetical protein
LFTKGHKYVIDELVRLWMAEGLVDSSNQNKRVEDMLKTPSIFEHHQNTDL